MQLRIVEGDIASQEVDAIVSSLSPDASATSGVELALRRRAGEGIFEECRRSLAALGREPTAGTVIVTTAGSLAARWVLHVMGPDHAADAEPRLARAYRRVLLYAASLGAQSIALPAVAAGRRAYPLADAARVAIRAVRDGPFELRDVRLVLRRPHAYRAFLRAFVNES